MPTLPDLVPMSGGVQPAPQMPPAGITPYALPPYAAPLLPANTKAIFGQLQKVVHRQRWKILCFVAAAVLIAAIVQFASPRLYSATALLRLDRHSAPGALGQEASQISAINDMDVVIDTDIEVAQSDPVIRPVAERYRLISYKPASLTVNGPVQLKGLTVTRPPNTYLMRITYRSWKSPQLAADVANGIAESLVKHVNDSLDHSYDQLSGAMRRDMDQLRSKMVSSSQRLTQYEKELNMVDPEQRSTVLTSRLTQLEADYTTAQVDRLNKQATLDAITKSPTLASAQATEIAGPRQTLLDQSLERLAAARQQFVSAQSYYGENHPEYRKAKQQLDEAEAQVEKTRVAANAKAEAEYRQASAREGLLYGQFESTKAQVDRLKADALAYTELKNEADNDRRMYMDLEARMREADVNRQFRDATIQFASPALPPGKAIFPKWTTNLPVALLLSLLLGVLGAIAADALDTTFNDAEDMSARMHFPVMGSLPDIPRPPANADALADLYYAEAIRLVRNAISASGTKGAPKSLLITSGAAAEGKSTTAAQLAKAFVKGGKRVLLIDADLRRPTLHKHFGVDADVGLADALTYCVPAKDVIVEVDSRGLYFMPAGPSTMDAADLITKGFPGLLESVQAGYDLIIVDAPPVLGLAETQEMASMLGGVVLIAKAHATAAKDLADALAALGRSRANVLGVVINRVKLPGSKRLTDNYRRYGRTENAQRVYLRRVRT